MVNDIRRVFSGPAVDWLACCFFLAPSPPAQRGSEQDQDEIRCITKMKNKSALFVCSGRPLKRPLIEPVGQLHPPGFAPEKTCLLVQMKKKEKKENDNARLLLLLFAFLFLLPLLFLPPLGPTKHKLKVTARLLKLRPRPDRSSRIGLLSDSAPQELIKCSHRSTSRPPTARRQYI